MTWIFAGMTAAEVAAAAAAAGTTAAAGTAAAGTAAAVGTAAAGAGAGAAGAGALGAGAAGAGAAGLTASEAAALTAAEGASLAAPAAEAGAGGMGAADAGIMSLSELPSAQTAMSDVGSMSNLGGANPMDSLGNIGSGNLNAEVTNLGQAPSIPGMGDMGLPNATSLFGGGGGEAPPMPAPAPMPAPTMPQAQAPPSTPGVPSSLFSKDNLKSAYQALQLGSKLVTNKRDKQTMGLATLATGLAANGGDISSPEAMKMFGDSLSDISAGVEQPKPAEPPPAPRLSQFQAPSTMQQPTSDRRLSSYFPPTRLI